MRERERRWGWLPTVLVWASATAFGLAVARVTRIGPSMPLTARHGVHVGDVAAFVIGYATAWVLTTRRRPSVDRTPVV